MLALFVVYQHVLSSQLVLCLKLEKNRIWSIAVTSRCIGEHDGHATDCSNLPHISTKTPDHEGNCSNGIVLSWLLNSINHFINFQPSVIAAAEHCDLALTQKHGLTFSSALPDGNCFFTAVALNLLADLKTWNHCLTIAGVTNCKCGDTVSNTAASLCMRAARRAS